MAHNKFFLKSFFVIYCLTLFFMGKTSFASQPTVQELKNFFDFVIAKQNSGELNYTYKFNVNTLSLAQYFYDHTQDINYTIDNLVFVTGPSTYDNNRGKINMQGFLFIANNSFGDDLLNFCYINTNSSSSSPTYFYNTSNNNSYFKNVLLIDKNGSFGINNNLTLLCYNDSSNLNQINYNGSDLISPNYILTTVKTASFYYNVNGVYLPVLNNYNGFDYYDLYPREPEIPDEPSGDIGGTTGTITNPSGDTTGKVDLSGIESGIGNINQNIDKTNEKLDGISGELNAISGELGNINENLTTVPDISNQIITSGEITSALNFDFAEDPYANFWLELTTGLSGALTNNVRSIDIQFRGQTYKIDLDKFAIQTPEFLRSFLSILSTVFIFWKMIRYWKIIINKITSGDMDEVLEMNEEEGIINLF